MKKKAIVLYGSDILRNDNQPVKEIDNSVKELVRSMFDSLKTLDGIGLAAPQVGKNLQIAIIDLSPTGEKKKRVLINPKIISYSMEKSIFEEGCLSFPGVAGNVKRPVRVTVRYTDIKGKEIKEKMDGMLSRASQHEIDHLSGTLFIDHFSDIDLQENKLVLKNLKNKNQKKK